MKVKTVGKNGQISIGKEHAGKHVTIERDDVKKCWIVKTVKITEDAPKRKRKDI